MLFYSRGGSIPRGGGRIDALLRAAPAESVSGVLRFTEQGENIAQNYGMRPNAMRSLERAFSTLALATLAVRRGVAVRESAALAECAGLVAGHSAQAWRGLVYEQPQFLEGGCAEILGFVDHQYGGRIVGRLSEKLLRDREPQFLLSEPAEREIPVEKDGLEKITGARRLQVGQHQPRQFDR